MMFYSDNPHRDFDRYEAEQEAQLEKLPMCDKCGEHIQDDYCYEINGEIYCEDCMNETFRRNVDSLID